MTIETQITKAIKNPPDPSDPAIFDGRTGKQKKIPLRVIKAIRLMLANKHTRMDEVAHAVGMNYTHLSTMLGKPHVQAFIMREASKKLGSATLRAAARMELLIDAQSEHVAFNAADRVLNQAGLKAKKDAQPNVNINVTAGFVIDLTGRRPGVRVIDHQPPIDGKPLIENDAQPEQSTPTRTE